MKLSPAQRLMAEDGAPSICFATAEQRAKWWRDNPPKAMPLFNFIPKNEDADTADTAAFRAQVEAERKERARAQIARMKVRLASKQVDFTKMRWDARRCKFVEDVTPAPRVMVTNPETQRKGIGATLNQLQAQRRASVAAKTMRRVEKFKTQADGIDWSRVTKDNAEAVARLNSIWKPEYEKLRGTGRIVMTVCNVLKGKVRRGEEVKWV